MSITLVVTQIGMLFLMIAVGYICGKTKIVPGNSSASLTSLLMKVLLPCTLFAANIREFQQSLIRDAVFAAVISGLFFSLAILINKFVTKILKVPKGKAAIWNICASFSNTGFVGFPVAQALFGDEGLFIASMINMMFNILAYTAGTLMVCKANGLNQRPHLLRVIFSNINIATFLGLIFFIVQIPVPDIILNTTKTLGAATTPISMIIVGLNMSKGSIKETLTDKDVLTATAMRLIVMPLLALLFVMIFPLGNDSLTKSIFPLIIAMPSPSVAVFLSETYGGDKVFASRIAVLTSLVCMITIPAFSMLL